MMMPGKDEEDGGWDDHYLEMNRFEHDNEPQEPRILVVPPEWLDPSMALPTDREFHRWIQEQTRRERHIYDNNGSNDSRTTRVRRCPSSSSSFSSCSSSGGGSSDHEEESGQPWKKILEAYTGFLTGMAPRARANWKTKSSRISCNDNDVVGLELSVKKIR